MELSLGELNKSEDPLVIFAKKTYQESLDYEKKYEAQSARRQLLKSKFIGVLKNIIKHQTNNYIQMQMEHLESLMAMLLVYHLKMVLIMSHSLD
jgi:hypothetical protein